MLSVNKVILMGTLAEDPVVRDIEGDGRIVGLSIFTTRRWFDASAGQQQEDKEWHRVVIIDDRSATYAATHLAKDDQVYLEGELQTTCWRDETYALQCLTRIILWQEGHQLRRVTDLDCSEPAAASKRLAAVRDAQLIKTLDDDALSHVA